jgi:hypothetical protein
MIGERQINLRSESPRNVTALRMIRGNSVRADFFPRTVVSGTHNFWLTGNDRAASPVISMQRETPSRTLPSPAA